MTENEFNIIFHQYRMAIFNFVNKMVNDKCQSEDITSIVFIKMWKAQPFFITEEKTKAWLFITAKRKALDYIKHRNLKIINPIHEEEYELSDHDINQIELSEIHETVLNRIMDIIKYYTQQEQVVFDLHYIQGLKPIDISRILNSKPQTVRNQLTAIRNKIREQIKKANKNIGPDKI